jgi:hypothetical protein
LLDTKGLLETSNSRYLGLSVYTYHHFKKRVYLKKLRKLKLLGVRIEVNLYLRGLLGGVIVLDDVSAKLLIPLGPLLDLHGPLLVIIECE